MARNLIIDQGNSRAKVSVFDNTHPLVVSSYDSLSPTDITAIVDKHRPDAAIYCSVSNSGEATMALLRQLVGHLYEMTSLLPLPISVNYATPSTLGRDRVAAAAGAAALFPGRRCLIIDAGTAITYDILSPDATFQGGNIAPGLWMRAKALHDMTARLPEVEVETPADLPLWGTSTPEAIRAGVVRGVVGEIQYYRTQAGDDAVTILTGGDATLLYHLLTHDDNLSLNPDLVNIGLNSILLYNEHL
jgi:type III pantothenate kinase